jgi:hypothetical protein
MPNRSISRSKAPQHSSPEIRELRDPPAPYRKLVAAAAVHGLHVRVAFHSITGRMLLLISGREPDRSDVQMRALGHAMAKLGIEEAPR